MYANRHPVPLGFVLRRRKAGTIRREAGKGVSTVSESDKNDDEAVAPQQQASGEPEKRSINDPLTRTGVESPRVPWQSQGSSPQTEKREGDEASGDAESGN